MDVDVGVDASVVVDVGVKVIAEFLSQLPSTSTSLFESESLTDP